MESTLRRTWAQIDLDALLHNYHALRKHVGEDVKFLGVVKADAYGHGSVMVSRTLEEAGADYLAVSSIDEAIELRVNDIRLPILILGHTPREQVGRLIDYDITQTVSCKAKAVEYSEEAVKLGKELKIHIKVDTGMGRLGYLCEGDFFAHGVDGILEALQLPGLSAEGIFTHFAVSDEVDEDSDAFTRGQYALFRHVIEQVEERWGHAFALHHCANSGATARFPEMTYDMIRPGLLLYGYGDFAGELGLRPVMTLTTTVSTIKIYPQGTRVSYGGIYVTPERSRIGVLPIGYADGLLRCLSNKVSFMTEDGLAPQRGRICMDMCMIDLSGKPDVVVGSEVEIFGRRNSINQVATLAGTIPYELTCSVSRRVPRRYLRDGKVIEKELLLRM